jgi:hypothetical protein
MSLNKGNPFLQRGLAIDGLDSFCGEYEI